jgi:putative PIN family toxin of toxin-antitoxin system
VKAVFDTNVLIAAFLTEGIGAKLMIRARRQDFGLILCDSIVDEFKRVLRKKFAASPHETSEALMILSEAAEEIHGTIELITPICRDSDDDLILACARDTVADFVVTGDEDLLILKNYEGISIATPREFEKLFPD